jgi:hypothetical protein
MYRLGQMILIFFAFLGQFFCQLRNKNALFLASLISLMAYYLVSNKPGGLWEKLGRGQLSFKLAKELSPSLPNESSRENN